ncbi:hypothetical protein BOTCAL_0133g00160 [Botryotinia calthae]|uniref:Uncharacterized protein n=1 Tax=Botryotinia calthae TaxID=38488 RepID=A0A4Y8D3N8_9HELO|nr:hypothetical protein BOTCAL_0133g00160 [Botryotinia calthae]
MEVLLSRGANVSKNPSKSTLLHLAAGSGDGRIVRLLLQYGADFQARNWMGRTPALVVLNLGLAGSASSADAFSNSDLLGPELELVEDNKFVSPAIEEAIRCRDLEKLKYLLQNGCSLEGSCSCGCSPLLVALTVAGKEVSHLIAEAGVSLGGVVVCPIPRPTAGFTPLNLAALYGDEQLLEKIIEIGQSNSVQSVHPLHIAAYNGYPACVRILLSHGFDGQCGVNDKTSLEKPLFYQEARMLSCKDGRMSIVQDICGTSLHYASLRGHIDVITELLLFGADLDAQDKDGCTPLHLATRCGHNQTCDLLVSAGASVLSRDHEGLSPIHYAIQKGYHYIVEIMIKQSVSSDSLLQHVGNLLDFACFYSNAETIEILIAAGMKIDSIDIYGSPALFSAISNAALTEEFKIKLLQGAENPYVYQTLSSESLLTNLCIESLLLTTRELLKRVPKDKIYQYINYISIFGTALYCAAGSREQSLKIAELLIDHGAELELIKPSHGTPLMGACYFGYYDMVVLLLKNGARTTCNKRDGTQMTAVEEARHHPDIVSLLKNFEQKGVEALNEPRPVLLANMVKVEGCMNRIAEEEEQGEDMEKEECEESGEDEALENDISEKDKE